MSGFGLEIAALVVAGATAASSAASALQRNSQLDQSAKLADYQKSISETNAGNARRASEAEGEDARRESRIRLGEMRAAFGANGIDIAGSPLDVLQDTAAEGELTAQRKEYAGKVQAVAYDNQAKMYGYQAATYRSNKSSGLSIAFNALTSGAVSGLGVYAAGGGFGSLGDAGDAIDTGDAFSGAAARSSASNTSSFLSGAP